MQQPRRSVPRPSGDPPAIPGYELGVPIGRGATGVVYRARQLAVDRDVAVKVLHPELCANPRVVQRLQREARTTARLAHPHLVSAIDMGETDGVWWYAMERIVGDSLDVRLERQGRLSERETLRLFIPLCEALCHLWEHGVIHRDIKPSNILIDRAGGARLADFGLAVAEDDPMLTRGGALGTPHYMSPEQAVDAKNVDIRTDLWSFGATLYHCVCGRPPFHGQSAAEILSSVLHEPITDPLELNPKLSKGLALVIRKCLTRERDNRYTTPQLLLEDLERVRERRDPSVTRRGLEPVRRDHDLSRKVITFALTLAILIGGLWGASLWVDARSAHATEARPLKAAPYPPLESLASRSIGRPGVSAQSLRELEELRADLPEVYVDRWQELDRTLRNQLRVTVREEQRAFEVELDAALDRGDFARAQRMAHEELGPRFLARTGLGPEGLARERVSIDPWIAQMIGRVDSATTTALAELNAAISAWTDERVTAADRLEDDGRWQDARALLSVDADQVLGALGLSERRYPARSLDEALANARIALRLRRQRLDDSWLATDDELKRWVRDSALVLQQDLRDAAVPFAASTELEAAFERELMRRQLMRDSMPTDLGRKALDELERRVEELAVLEGELRERAARAEFAELDQLAQALAARRDYRAMLGLWDEASIVWADADEDAGWVAELKRKAQLRRFEARKLDELLQRAARALGELEDDASVRIQGILYPAEEIQSGADPLSDGFWIRGRDERFELRELTSGDLERLAGLDELQDLDPSDRLLAALFWAYEGSADEARRALRSGRLPDREPEGSLVRELGERVSATLERDREEEKRRADEADRLLAFVVDPDRIEHSPTGVVVRIDRLLDDYSDVPVVQSRRRDLVRLKRRLQAGGDLGSSAFETVFAPRSLSLMRPARVRLEFDFDLAERPAWERGDWTSDGFGWVSPPDLSAWEDLRTQEGPRLALQRPLDVETFEVTLEIEDMHADARERLVLVRAAGFHVVLGTDPDEDGPARWLYGTSGADDVLERFRKGEGDALEGRWSIADEHELVLRGDRASGHLELELDDRVLGRVQAGVPDPDDYQLELRSRTQLRLQRVVVEAGR